MTTPVQDERDDDEMYGVIVRQSSYGAAAKAAGMGLGFVVAFVLARYFGAAAYGEFKMVIAITNLLLAFSMGGFGSALQKWVPFQLEKARPDLAWLVIRYAYTWALVGALVIAALLFLFRHRLGQELFNSPGLANALAAGALVVAVETLLRITGNLYAACRQPFAAGLHMDVTSRLVFLAGLAGLVATGHLGAAPIVAAFVMGDVIVLALLAGRSSVLKLPPSQEAPRGVETAALRQDVLSFSVTMMMTGFLGVILHSMDTLMLGYFRTAEDVGVYNIAVRYCALSNLITMSSGRIVVSMVASLYARQDRVGLQALARSVTRWFAALVMPFWITTLFFAEPMMCLFGAEYAVGAGALRVLVSGVLVMVSTFMTGPILLANCGLERRYFASNVVMVLINLGLNVWWIPRWGLAGAAWATLAAQVVSALMWIILTRTRLGLSVVDRNSLVWLLNTALCAVLAALIASRSLHIVAALVTGAVLMAVSIGVTMWTGERSKDLFCRLFLPHRRQENTP